MLAAFLLMGAGGAVAIADTGSSDSAAHADDGTTASGHQTSTKKPKTPKNEPSGTATRGGTLGGQSGQQHSAEKPNQPKNQPGGTATQDETKDSAPIAAATDGVAPVTDGVVPVTDGVAPVTDGVAPVTDGVAPVTDGVAPVTDGVAPVTDGVAPVTDGVAPVTDGVAPGSDVIALMQDMLTSVAGVVVPLTQLQSDLSSFLLGIAGVEPVVAVLGGGAGRSAAAGASVASQVALVLPLAGVPGVPVSGNATGIAPLLGVAPSTFGAMSQVGPASSLPGMAPSAPSGAIPMGVRSFLRHARELPLPLAVSLAALAAAALPGAGGLVILAGAGVRVGYRQAKAGVALRTTGIAHFAAPGPLGVVRSGSLVVVRPRALRVVPPGGLSAEHLLDKAA